jgi:hypothetical protein
MKYDIAPWILYGNASDDKSNIGQRSMALLNAYTPGMRKLGNKYNTQVSNAFTNTLMSDVSKRNRRAYKKAS